MARPLRVHERCCLECQPAEAIEVQRRRALRGHDFWPSSEELEQLPLLYATEGVPLGDRTIW